VLVIRYDSFFRVPWWAVPFFAELFLLRLCLFLLFFLFGLSRERVTLLCSDYVDGKVLAVFAQ